MSGSINHHLTVCMLHFWVRVVYHEATLFSNIPSGLEGCLLKFLRSQANIQLVCFPLSDTHCLEVLLCFVFCFHSCPSGALSQLNFLYEVNGPPHICELLPFGTLLNVMLLFVVYRSQFSSRYFPLSCTVDQRCVLYAWLKWEYWTSKTLLLSYHFLYWFITVLSITS